MGVFRLMASLADAGLSLSIEGDRLIVRPASQLTDSIRQALKVAKPQLLQLSRAKSNGMLDPDSWPAWADEVMSRFIARRDRLVGLGWSKRAAEALAEDLAQRGADNRVTCVDCLHCKHGRCLNHKAAALNVPQIGPDLIALPQHCPGFHSI